MKHYTETIPSTLAEKLKEKGMHHLRDSRMEGWLNSGSNITYAEAFDWLIEEKGIYISICHRYTSIGLEWYPMVNNFCPGAIDGREWVHSANLAIRKALEIIGENQNDQRRA